MNFRKELKKYLAITIVLALVFIGIRLFLMPFIGPVSAIYEYFMILLWAAATISFVAKVVRSIIKRDIDFTGKEIENEDYSDRQTTRRSLKWLVWIVGAVLLFSLFEFVVNTLLGK